MSNPVLLMFGFGFSQRARERSDDGFNHGSWVVMGLNFKGWRWRGPAAALLHASVDQFITPLATQPEPQPKLLGAGRFVNR